MVARSESMFSYDSYSYRLWSLANVWNTCQPPSLSSGPPKDEDLSADCPPQGCQLAYKEHAEAAAAAASPPPVGGPYGCAQCNASFAAKDQLEKHEVLHSPNAQVSCKICNKTFANVYRLQRHMISHDESAILRKFKCTECDKAFKFKHHLKEHIRIHSGEKPFECGNCGKRFSHSGSYSSHMTSKKCLVMNLKHGRTRPPTSNSSLTDKNIQQAVRSHQKRPSITPINNNIPTSPNHNSYLPILPKYSEAAAAFLQTSLAGNPSLSPFYLSPHGLINSAHGISPYTMPALGHLLEQLQQQSSNHLRPQLSTDCGENNRDISIKMEPSSMDVDEKSEDHDPEKSNSSEVGDLVMDEEAENPETETHVKVDPEPPPRSNGDLEAVKRILETVNATVTKELLHANMQKAHSDASSDSHSVVSAHSPKQDYNCSSCKKTFESSSQLEDHECEDIRSEGLAAKLEDAITTKSSDEHHNGSVSSGEDQDYERSNYNTNDEMESESYTTTDHVNEDGRKVRVRSLISDEQLKVLKDNYKLNPRPKREELEKIASTIGFSVRVVQVWFQNTRARDRREGRLIQVPYSPAAAIPRYSTSSLLEQKPTSPHYSCEQPLDLSLKKDSGNATFHEASSAECSPRRPTSVNHSEITDEAVNLSQKSSRSPTPYMSFQNQFHQNSNSSDPRQSPSPLELSSSRLAQILAQPGHKFSGIAGLMPMDQLMHFGGDLPSLSQLINNSLSPSSTHSMHERDDDDMSNPNKRRKMTQFVLKGLSSPGLGQEVDVEGLFQCDQCDKSFSKQSSLARHKYEHSGQRPHKCNECTKAFKHKHHLTEHKRLHSGEKPYQCGKCLKKFSHSGSYSQHMNHRYSYCKPYRE